MYMHWIQRENTEPKRIWYFSFSPSPGIFPFRRRYLFRNLLNRSMSESFRRISNQKKKFVLFSVLMIPTPVATIFRPLLLFSCKELPHFADYHRSINTIHDQSMNARLGEWNNLSLLCLRESFDNILIIIQVEEFPEGKWLCCSGP